MKQSDEMARWEHSTPGVIFKYTGPVALQKHHGNVNSLGKTSHRQQKIFSCMQTCK